MFNKHKAIKRYRKYIFSMNELTNKEIRTILFFLNEKPEEISGKNEF